MQKLQIEQNFVGSLSDFCNSYISHLSEAYNYGFGVACVSLIASVIIYFGFRKTFKHVEGQTKQGKTSVKDMTTEELTPTETKQRIIALCLVFAVVIFFWMAFHQNGLTMTFFARDYTNLEVTGLTRVGFNVWNLALLAIFVYAAFAVFQSKKKIIPCIVAVAAIVGVVLSYSASDVTIQALPSDFQQFNPFFVVALTPVSLAIFSYLAFRGKEPSAPRKIALGMLVAACCFVILAIGYLGLPTPDALKADAGLQTLVSPNWLISTYLVLTFAELLLSPMGISFVSKVAPPKLKGMMMGGWFAATAIGNYAVKIIGNLWGGIDLWILWTILIVLCILSAIFMFAMMKRLEKVC